MKSLVEALAERGYDWTPQPEEHPTLRIAAAVRHGNAVHVSGQIASTEPKFTGKVTMGNLEDAQLAAEKSAVQCLYAAGAIVAPEAIVRVIKLRTYVNVGPYFNQMSLVANGATSLLAAVLGEAGCPAGHARVAIGVASLPYDALVEIEAVFEVE